MDYNGVEMELNDGQAYNRMLALSNVLWEHYSLLAHRYFTEQNPAINSNSRRDQFQRHGYYFSETASELASNFRKIYEKGDTFEYDLLDHHADFRHNPDITDDEAKRRNLSCRFLLLSQTAKKKLRNFLEEIKLEVEEAIGTYWKVANVRCMQYREGVQCGPFDFHRDGWPTGLKKILIYVRPPNLENGTTELITPVGDNQIIDSEVSSWLVFAPGNIDHRPIVPARGVRESFQINLLPAFKTDTKPVFSGLGASYPWLPNHNLAEDLDINSLEYDLSSSYRGFVNHLVAENTDNQNMSYMNHGVAPEKGNEKLALLTQMVENQRQIIVAKDAAISRLQGNVTEFIKRELKLANHL